MPTYIVPAIHCGHCKNAIEGEVSRVPGVARVEVDVDSKRVVIEGDPAEDAVLAAIAEAGYEEVQSA